MHAAVDVSPLVHRARATRAARRRRPVNHAAPDTGKGSDVDLMPVHATSSVRRVDTQHDQHLSELI
jgi:hypothetical protein